MTVNNIYGSKRTYALLARYKKGVSAFLPNKVLIPLNQSLQDSGYEWVVKVGDKIKEGGVLATKEEEGVNLYSSIPGIVKEFKSCVTPEGRLTDGVVIVLGGSFSYLGKKLQKLDTQGAKQAQVQNALLKSGVLNTVCHNKAIPLIKSVMAAQKRGVKSLVVKVHSIDETCVTDEVIYRLNKDEVKQGAQIIAKALDEVQVVYATSEKTLQKYNGKSDVLFVDASTAFDVYRTITFNTPLIDKFVLVSGDCIDFSGLIKVRVGMTFLDVAKLCGGLKGKCDTIIVNGFLTGLSTYTTDSPVTKYTKSIYFVKDNKVSNQTPTECISCGECQTACHMKLPVKSIYNFLQINKGDKRLTPFGVNGYSLDKDGESYYNVYEKASRLCDGCGMCNLVCPSRIPLCQAIFDR